MTEGGAPVGHDRPPEVLRSPALDHFTLDRREPAPPLHDIVRHYWTVEWSVPPGEERVQDVVTHPCVHLTVEGDRATVTGVVTRSFRRTLVGSGRVIGVRFRPAGFSALWREPLSTLTDEALPAATVLGADAQDELAAVGAAAEFEEATQLLDGFLRRRRLPRPPGAELVDRAVDHIVTCPEVMRVDEVAGHFGVSPRTLERHFERHLGVGPKWIVRRRRIHEALTEIEQGRDLEWSALATRLGFADQAHFVNAFTELVGQPPSRYEADRSRSSA